MSDAHDNEPGTHKACPDCASSDARTIYPGGDSHCFSCGRTRSAKQNGNTEMSDLPDDIMDSDEDETFEVFRIPDGCSVRPLPTRKITLATAKKWSYQTKGKNEYAVYKDPETKQITGLKKRTPDKKFPWIGKPACLYGQWLWSNRKGKMVVITEGEIDAITVGQAFGNNWPVVSLTGGAKSCKRDITKAIGWLSEFETIVLWFDNDEQGREATEIAAKILPPGKVKIVNKVEAKDANELLITKGGKAVTDAVWAAEEWNPGGMVSLDKLINDDLLEPPTMGIPWSWDWMNRWTYGRRYGEVYGFGAGTGVGKSDFLLQEMAHTLEIGEDVGLFSFENGSSVTARLILSKMVKTKLHVPGADKEQERQIAAKLDEAKEYYKTKCANLYLNDMRGSREWEDVKPAIRAYVHSKGLKHIVLDNLTALADPTRERESLEIVMREMTGLAEELNICIYYVSHLTTPETGSHEEGARVTIRQFKGSRSIGFWSFFIFGMERDQQGDGDGYTTFRCLKDRFTGEATGKTIDLTYNVRTGMYEVAPIIDKVMQAVEEADDH